MTCNGRRRQHPYYHRIAAQRYSLSARYGLLAFVTGGESWGTTGLTRSIITEMESALPAAALWISGVVVMLTVLAVGYAWWQPLPSLPKEPATTPPHEVLLEMHRAGCGMFADTDKAMWQIVSVFLPGSLLLMGWAVTTKNLPEWAFVMLGSASILLAGTGALLKLRLRSMNVLQLRHLQRLERVLLGTADADGWGVHQVRIPLWAHGLGQVISLHGVILIYFLLFTGTWVGMIAIRLGWLH